MRFYDKYHTIRAEIGQVKRKTRVKKVVYNVKKITKEKRRIC